MSIRLNVNIKTQPDYTTCGPTSLHAVYSFYYDNISLTDTVKEITQFSDGGGTLASVLGKHALNRGYKATIVSFNINVFDPSWFGKDNKFILSKIKEGIENNKTSKKHIYALKAYEDFLKAGGNLKFQDLSKYFLRDILKNKIPILTGLSSTWLYRDKRENPITNEYDDVSGQPAGHFVIIDGYSENNNFSICDPYHKNPINLSNHYYIDGDRLVNSILLGISSYDGNLLLIEKK